MLMIVDTTLSLQPRWRVVILPARIGRQVYLSIYQVILMGGGWVGNFIFFTISKWFEVA